MFYQCVLPCPRPMVVKIRQSESWDKNQRDITCFSLLPRSSTLLLLLSLVSFRDVNWISRLLVCSKARHKIVAIPQNCMCPYEPTTPFIFWFIYLYRRVSHSANIHSSTTETHLNLGELTRASSELTCSLLFCRLLCSSSISPPFSLWVFRSSSVLFFSSSVNHSTRFSSSSFSCSISL